MEAKQMRCPNSKGPVIIRDNLFMRSCNDSGQDRIVPRKPTEAEQKVLDQRLRLAAEYGDTKEALNLIEQGAGVNARNELDWTPLLCASSKGHTETAKMLIEHGAHIDAPTNVGWTPLMVAAYYGHPRTVELLIERGADVNARDWSGQTVLRRALLGRGDTAMILMDHGAYVR
jgi:uncharacterized protein